MAAISASGAWLISLVLACVVALGLDKVDTADWSECITVLAVVGAVLALLGATLIGRRAEAVSIYSGGKSM
jgi:hypothetical protein